MKVPLSKIAHTRSGDKGDTCNIGVIAYHEHDYPVLVREVTAERLKRHFGELVKEKREGGRIPPRAIFQQPVRRAAALQSF